VLERPSATAHREVAPFTALNRAGTAVHEPIHRFHLELPTDLLGTAPPTILRLGQPSFSKPHGRSTWSKAKSRPARVHELRQQLPGLTRGEGVVESAFGHYAPAVGPLPTRPRSDHNPLTLKEYLIHVVRRV
jgi:ribosomal protection tetracycline resistance protein